MQWTRPRLHNEPHYKQRFFDYFVTYVTSRFHRIGLRRTSGGSNTQRVPWEAMSLNLNGGRDYIFVTLTGPDAAVSVWCHWSVVRRDKGYVTTQLRTAGYETTSVTRIYVTFLNKPVVNLWFVLFVGRSSLFLCQYLTWAYWLYPKEFPVFLS